MDASKKERLERLRKRINSSVDSINNHLDNLDSIANQYDELAKKAGHVGIIIEDIDKQFSSITKLTSRDIKFLFVAVAMQCIRQYFIGYITQRTSHDVSDKSAHEIQKKIFGTGNKEDGVRYRATREEIMYSVSVPYDAITGTKQYGVGTNKNGEACGLSGTTHRYQTLGHDPLFGWVFGTANIMTNTLTNNVGKTFHVKKHKVVSHGGYDKTAKMLGHVVERSKESPSDLGICLIKQGLHLASDTFSKQGIALPGTVKLDNNLAMSMAEYGVDLGNTIKLGEQSGFSILINQIIAMIHRMIFDESIEYSKEMYEVRTRKILMYSNTIASMSNVIAVACGAAVGYETGADEMVKQSLNYFDIGGLIVTIGRIASDTNFIQRVKQEFLEKQWYDYVTKD